MTERPRDRILSERVRAYSNLAKRPWYVYSSRLGHASAEDALLYSLTASYTSTPHTPNKYHWIISYLQ